MQKQVYEFISQKTNDPIIERRTCQVSGKVFAIFQSDKEFYEKISPVFGGKEYLIPFPTLCPEERQRRRLLFRNERKLYRRVCDLTGKNIISIYAPESEYTVYNTDTWRSDHWDPMKYGNKVDTQAAFFSQFFNLLTHVPKIARHVIGNENSEYVTQCGYSKDCYMTFNTDFSEKCIHTKDCDHCVLCIDCLNGKESSECFLCIHIEKCSHCFYTQNASNSSYLYGCKNMIGCHHCINCVSLNNQSYCIDNKKVTKQEFENHQKPNQFINPKHENYKKNVLGENTENCYGSEIYSAKDVILSYNIHDAKNVKYSYDFVGSIDTYDHSTGGYNTAQCYELISSGDNNYMCVFSSELWGNDNNIFYSQFCVGCSHCFGCVGLRNKSYCILNKQYTKEEYEQLVPKIIEHMKETGEWGEFFHPSLSPFGYNETVAQEYYSLTREEALARGYKRQDKEYPINIPEGIETIEASELPRAIGDVSNEILTKAIICEHSGKPFRIIKPELEFYKKHKLPLPRKHPDIRHQERLAKRPGRELYLRKCDKTGEEILSVYPEGVPFKVYSEEAYKQEIYG